MIELESERDALRKDAEDAMAMLSLLKPDSVVAKNLRAALAPRADDKENAK